MENSNINNIIIIKEKEKEKPNKTSFEYICNKCGKNFVNKIKTCTCFPSNHDFCF